jgi:hypothetical protein
MPSWLEQLTCTVSTFVGLVVQPIYSLFAVYAQDLLWGNWINSILLHGWIWDSADLLSLQRISKPIWDSYSNHPKIWRA